MKYPEVIRIIEENNRYRVRTRGSHMIYEHSQKPGTVTVPSGGKLNRDIPPKTLKSVLVQAGLSRE